MDSLQACDCQCEIWPDLHRVDLQPYLYRTGPEELWCLRLRQWPVVTEVCLLWSGVLLLSQQLCSCGMRFTFPQDPCTPCCVGALLHKQGLAELFAKLLGADVPSSRWIQISSNSTTNSMCVCQSSYWIPLYRLQTLCAFMQRTGFKT